MAISQIILSNYGAQSTVRKAAVEEARVLQKQTAFLSHSHHDAHMAKGLQQLLRDHGWEVYIDWEDTTMPSTPNRETAERIQRRIGELDWFFFLATANSVGSRWCPWELGYADGEKPYDSILIIPTRDRSGTSHGSEYLQLYRFIDEANGGGIGAFRPGGKGYLVESMTKPF